ncbi:MAG: DNA repair protein RecO [Candidatus Peregrinibacteria bacterium]
MKSKLFKTEGVVIRRMDLGEADQIVTLLTPELGKIHCIAKGCRKLTSKFCGRVELYYRLHVTGYWGRDFGYLKEVEVLDDTTFFDLSLARHHALATVAEVTHKLIQDEQNVEGVYPLLCEVSRSLKTGNRLQTELEMFLQKLLSLLGFTLPTEKKPMAVLRTILNGPLKSERFLAPVRLSPVRP